MYKWIATNSGLAVFDEKNWKVYTQFDSGLPNNGVYSIAIQGIDKWIGTGGGLGRFDGTNWTRFRSDSCALPNNQINDITVDASGCVWISTGMVSYGGLAAYKEGGITSTEHGDHISLHADFVLNENYPNPFNPSTTLTFSIPTRSFVSLKLFDVMGREVSTIVSEEMPAGTYSREWIASGFPSGVYFYRLQGGGYTETKRLILSK